MALVGTVKTIKVLCALGLLVVLRWGSWLTVTLYVVVGAAVYSWWSRAIMMAGPRTSRQVPPQPIARCQQLSAGELSDAYRRGELRVVDVVQTYIDHIKRVNPYLNLMVFDCFDEAIKAAREADRVYDAWRKDKTKPAPSWLLGVPCTIKECMECKGCPNSSGHPSRRNVISDVDSPVVQNFREAGAIILGVTNTSELCMWYESSNYVYGISCNPFDTRCQVGGSSGGEGASAGAAFSTFSLGSDIGGSIRMPAFFNGVFGHKASPHYISNRGQHPGAKTSANHYMATGPISRFPQDIIPLCQVAAKGGFQEDPAEYPPCSPLAQVLDLRHKPLRVYALEDFGLPRIFVSRSQIEALHTAAETLREKYNAEITYINLRDKSRCSGGVVPPEFESFSKVLSMWSSALTKDPTETKFHDLMSEGHGPGGVNWVAECFRWVMGKSEHTLPAIALCVVEMWEQILPSFMTISDDTNLLGFKMGLEELLQDNGIILAPSFPSAAQRHHQPIFNPFQFQYTAAFNVLQLPATACPVWSTDMAGQRKALTSDEVRRRGLPKDYHLPKGVQVVSATHQDELCVSVAIALQEELGGYRYPGWAMLEGDDY